MKINREFVRDLYDPSKSGIAILRESLSEGLLSRVCSEIEKKMDAFVVKREKVIQNNQRVALLYRGPFDSEALCETSFSEIVQRYLNVRSEVSSFLPSGFVNGTSIEIKLIHYPVSSMGVDVHRDLSSNVNLIAFFNLSGRANVQTFSDKAGSCPADHWIGPGDVSLMRAPLGRSDPDIRPYHGVIDVPEPRTVLVFREMDEILEREINKDNWMGF